MWLNWQGLEELFLIDGNGQLVHNWATPGEGSGWSGWYPMSTPAGVAMTGLIGPDEATPLGSHRLYVKDTSANYWSIDSITTGTGWTEWTNTGTTSPTP